MHGPGLICSSGARHQGAHFTQPKDSEPIEKRNSRRSCISHLTESRWIIEQFLLLWLFWYRKMCSCWSRKIRMLLLIQENWNVYRCGPGMLEFILMWLLVSFVWLLKYCHVYWCPLEKCMGICAEISEYSLVFLLEYWNVHWNIGITCQSNNCSYIMQYLFYTV